MPRGEKALIVTLLRTSDGAKDASDMNVIVCGGRGYFDQAKVDDVLDTLHWRQPIKAILQGGATGADKLGREWADRKNVKVCTFIAGKKSSGQASWSRGNQRMIDEGKPDLIVAFPGVKRTADMIRRARRSSVTVLLIDGAGGDGLAAA
jgi:hypothetical protein